MISNWPLLASFLLQHRHEQMLQFLQMLQMRSLVMKLVASTRSAGMKYFWYCFVVSSATLGCVQSKGSDESSETAKIVKRPPQVLELPERKLLARCFIEKKENTHANVDLYLEPSKDGKKSFLVQTLFIYGRSFKLLVTKTTKNADKSVTFDAETVEVDEVGGEFKQVKLDPALNTVSFYYVPVDAARTFKGGKKGEWMTYQICDVPNLQPIF
jgi:hypothetical protein